MKIVKGLAFALSAYIPIPTKVAYTNNFNKNESVNAMLNCSGFWLFVRKSKLWIYTDTAGNMINTKGNALK